MPFDVIVMGAGQIASGYDLPYSNAILTHAHAVIEHSGFNLLGFYDADIKKAEDAARKWNASVYEKPVSTDVIVICTPDACHLNSIRQAIDLGPKMIVLEKPLANTLGDTKKIIELTKSIPVQVNFTRRFVREFQELSVEVKNYGAFLTGAGLYGKGFIHNGSHMVDLLRMLLGEISIIRVINETFDFFPDDATKTTIISFEQGGEFFMRGLDCRHYTVFELELCFEKGRIKVLDSGQRIQVESVMPSDKYSGYINLSFREEIHTEIDKAMGNLYRNAYDFLMSKAGLLSPIETVFTESIYI